MSVPHQPIIRNYISYELAIRIHRAAGIALYRRIRRRRHLIAWVILTVILFVALGVMYVVTGLNLEPGPALLLALVGAPVASGLYEGWRWLGLAAALLFLYLMFRNGR